MKILSLNIRHGGGKRVAPLCDWIINKDSDVIILTEWRNNASGQYVCNRLTECGFDFRLNSNLLPRANGVLVAAKQIVRSRTITPPNAASGELMLIELPSQLRIMGCYFPQSHFKAPFFHQCLEETFANQDQPFVMIGDLNTGRNDLDIEGRGAPFHCADLFQALTDKGRLIDLWRHRYRDRQDWTWRSSMNGFRIDHAFGNESFVQTFPDFQCEIDHEPRISRMTDHSAVMLATSAS
jgi:exonuclease III